MEDFHRTGKTKDSVSWRVSKGTGRTVSITWHREEKAQGELVQALLALPVPAGGYRLPHHHSTHWQQSSQRGGGRE